MAWEDACALIKSAKAGTGYLVSPTSMITCQHVVGDESKVIVRLRGKGDVTVDVERIDKVRDLALLTFPGPITGVEPLKFASCPSDTRWKTFGYPAIAQGLAIPMGGYVAQSDGMDSLGQASVVLYADEVKDNGQTVSGLSGGPVVVNGLVVGNIKRILENPDKRGWPLYGLLWATPSSEILKFLGQGKAGAVKPVPAGVDRLAGVFREIRTIISATGVYALWNSLRDTGVVDEQLSILAAKLLRSNGRPELALEIANSLGDTVAARRLRAHVIGDMVHRLEDSIQIFEQLDAEGNLDAESGGMLAGRYRRMWTESKGADDAWRRKSADTYKRFWDTSGDPYCGINAAAMALQEDRKPDSLLIAASVLAKLNEKPINRLDYWDFATMGEAHLLLGDIVKAREAYRQAKGLAAGKDHDIAIMWNGAVMDLSKLGLPPNSLDAILRPRTAAAFFGHSIDSPGRQPPRFPASRVGNVRQAIAEKIRQRSIGFGVCSACRGSDLLFLDELIKQNGRALVVLTSPRQEFARTFIGPTWQPIFDDVMNSGKVEVRVLEPADDAWQQVRIVVRAEVRIHANSRGCDPLLIAVWDGGEETYVGESVLLWHASGYPVDHIPVGAAQVSVA